MAADAFVGELEGAPVMAERLLGAQEAHHFDRLLRVHVVVAHEPARLIGADRQQSEAEGPVLLPELAGERLSLDVLQAMADTGDAWPLIEGTGRIYGLYVIESLQTTRTLFFQDGAARRIDFSLSLKRVADTGLELGSVLGELLLDQIR